MKRLSAIFSLWLTLTLAASSSAAVKVVISGGILRDAGGATLAPGSLVAIVASTQDNVFGAPAPSSTLQVGATLAGDDVVLAVFPVGPQNTGADGGFLGIVSFDYAAMGIPNLGAGDQLKLYWFPAASLSGTQILSNASYGSYRADTLASRSNTTWVAPNDSSGGTLELNFQTQALGGDLANSVAIAALNVSSSTNDVTVAATDATAAEPSDSGTFTFTRGGSTAGALTVNFTVSGTAIGGTDYTSLGTTVTFAAGSATATRQVSVIDDALVESAETVVLTLAGGGGYTVGSPAAATVTIQDDESANAVAVSATDTTASEPGTGQGTGTFTFTRSGSTASTLMVNFTVGGTATAGSDYTALGTTVSFAVGSSSATKTVSVTDDSLAEGDETVVLTLASGSGYAVSSPSSATVTIQDDDGAVATTSYVTGAALGALRNDYTGWVGMQIVVGVNPLTVSQLGRLVAPGNTGTHMVKLVQASNGVDVPGGAVAIATSGGTVGQFNFASLSSPVTLTAGTTYWIVTQETSGGDYWYDAATTITTTDVATDNGVTWGAGPGNWNPDLASNRDYGPVNFKYAASSVPPDASTSYVTGVALGSLRNDYGGWVGMQIVIGANPLTVSQLGRLVAPGNAGTHTVKIVQASDGVDVPGGAVAIAMSGGTVGQFNYGNLSSPVTLTAGATYWIVTQETSGGDYWYDAATTITTTSVATDNGVTWGSGPGNWNPDLASNRDYGPVNFKYTTGTVPPGNTISYVTGAALGSLRNDYGGWVGMQIVVGANPLTVSQLGRLVAPGNTGTHNVKIVQASNGVDVPGGAVVIATSGGTVGQFNFTSLSSPVTLNASTTYWIVTQEISGGDYWYDAATTITTTDVATDNGVTWGSGPGNWNPDLASNRDYGPVNFKYTAPAGSGTTTAYITGASLGSLRNDYGGWIGMQFVVGANPLTVSQLGRLKVLGNIGTHAVKLVQASNGIDVPGGAVSLSMIGGTPGQFIYATLSSPVTLNAGATYWIVTQETAGGDYWYDAATTVTTTNVATDNGVTWGSGPGNWNPDLASNRSYGPVNFKY